MKKIILCFFFLTFGFYVSAQQSDTLSTNKEKSVILQLVKQFQEAVGNYELDSIPGLFSPKANITGIASINGKWRAFTLNIDEFLENLKTRSNASRHTETILDYSVRIDKGIIAFARVETEVELDNGKTLNHINYFILSKEAGIWKILNCYSLAE